MRKFDPVHLPPDRALNGKVSQTLAAKFNSCRRSAYLYQVHEGGAASHEMLRGSALHEVLERSTVAAINGDERTIPPEIVKAIVDEVLREMDVPVEEHDYIRESAYRWASETTIPPAEEVLAVETLFVLELAGWTLRGKIDYAESRDGGVRAGVRDYKSSRHLPSFEDIARKRPDGTMAAKGFQLVLYALMLAFGRPVRIEPCANCDDGIDRVDRLPCDVCNAKGRVEVVEPFPLAAHAHEFEVELVFPGIENREGRMATRPVTVTRAELDEYRGSIIGLLERLEQAERDGDWPAVPGSHCSECSAPALCPIPKELRNYAGTINTIEEAREAAEVLDREKDDHAARMRELKLFAKVNGGEIRYGADKALRFVYSESTRIADKDAMFDAVERAVNYGESFNRAQFVKPTSSTNFKVVTLTAEELAEEEGSDG